MRRFRRGLSGFLVASMAAALLLPTTTAEAATTADSAAPGAPGSVSHQDQSRKDCVGTARNTTYTATADPTGMICTVTATAKSGKYKLLTTYLTDPARDSVVVHTQYIPLTSAARNYQLYVRLDANAGGNGGGGAQNGGADTAVTDTTTGSPIPVSFDTSTTSQATTRDYAVPSYLAVRADQKFSSVSSGFVGTPSDGLSELDASHALSPTYTSATSGNVAQTAGVQRDRTGAFTLALGFGTTQAAAVSTAGSTIGSSLPKMIGDYESAWLKYDAGLRPPSLNLQGLSLTARITAAKDYYQSANVVKASEDKTFPGAIVAGLDAPWGQSISAGDPNNLFATGYREVFARDLYEAWTALYTDGDIATAQATTRYLLLKSQLPDGSEPRNSLVNGTKAPDAFNTQFDEASYPILMDLQSGLAADNALWPHVQAAANFLISHGPSNGSVERWEEQSGYSPSTISAEIAGLVAAATIAGYHNDPADARTWLATADLWQRNAKIWGVTSTGSLSTSPYFIRLSKTGDPNAAISYGLGNGGPTLDQRNVADLGFLEYVRLGELPATDPVVQNSLKVVDATLEKQTASGPGWLRYNGDGYGDCYVSPSNSCSTTGVPWTNSGANTGTGHPWPVLGVERAQQDLADGQKKTAASLLSTINKMNSGPGLVPEQVWDDPDVPASPYGTDPATASIGFTNGQADGSASPLTWGSASQVRLTADLSAGRSLETPKQTTDRYVTHTQKSTALTVTSPADLSAAGATITVAGTAAPGATIDISDVATDNNNSSTHTTTTADASGAFSVAVTSVAGTNVLVISSTAKDGGTAQVTRSVVNDVVNGTLLYSQADPTGDDNGPGKYAYPTAGDFHAGAFDLTNFQVYDTGSTVTFRVQTADLTGTFGATNGAQLVDVYVHNPAATSTSTASSYPGMNYSIGASSAWNRLIEVQGFGNSRFADPTGANVGTVTVAANSVTKYTTFSVDKTALGGTPGSGWGFTVTLTGQDGTHGTDQTRSFSSTPGSYSFGVCATNDGSAFCTADPNTVPKVMDLLTPAGTTQADELNYTAHPVVLQDVTIP